jgi:hypothetical protein
MLRGQKEMVPKQDRAIQNTIPIYTPSEQTPMPFCCLVFAIAPHPTYGHSKPLRDKLLIQFLPLIDLRIHQP